MSDVYGYVPLTTPLFWLLHHSRDPPFYTYCQLLSPVFRFSKNSAFLGPFLSDFGKISAPNTLILPNICSHDPSFFKKKIYSVDPTLEI